MRLFDAPQTTLRFARIGEPGTAAFKRKISACREALSSAARAGL